MTAAPYPNVRLRAERTQTAPGTETARTTIVFHLRGQRFRIVDESGRSYSEIVADVAEPRGFGSTPRTMEEFMDAFELSQRQSSRPPTELRGDLAASVAAVREAGGEPWPVDIDRIVPVAEQVLFGGRDAAEARSVRTATMLGRSCTEYRRALRGSEGTYAYRSEVRLLVSEPFVLLREVVDTANSGLSARLEVVGLDEGVVTERDL